MKLGEAETGKVREFELFRRAKENVLLWEEGGQSVLNQAKLQKYTSFCKVLQNVLKQGRLKNNAFFCKGV